MEPPGYSKELIGGELSLKLKADHHMVQHMLQHLDPLFIYSESNRKRFLLAGILSIVAIALIDAITPKIPLGFLYLFPILLMAGFLSRKSIVIVALICALLVGRYSDYPLGEAFSISLMAWVGLTGTGLLVSEILRSRRLTLEHEQELQDLVESSPLAIVTFDSAGRILLANRSAQDLLAPGGKPILGLAVSEFLPALQKVAEKHHSALFQTELRCRGKRENGEPFLAAVWFSTSTFEHRIPVAAAFIVDLSQDLRDREDQSLQHLVRNAKIVAGAIAHEVRNLCGAVRITYQNLSRVPNLSGNEDFRALGSLVEGLERLSAMELGAIDEERPIYVDLSSVLDELRVVVEPAYREAGMEIVWQLDEEHRWVRGNRYGLLQVFLNIVQNSQRAMIDTEEKQLTIRVKNEQDSVLIQFEDTGTGVARPENLFRPFQPTADSTGLGLYLARAILKSFDAQIAYTPRARGSLFSVILQCIAVPEVSNV